MGNEAHVEVKEGVREVGHYCTSTRPRAKNSQICARCLATSSPSRKVAIMEMLPHAAAEFTTLIKSLQLSGTLDLARY